MNAVFRQHRGVWTYVFVKQGGTLLDIIAVIATASFGLTAGALVLCARFVMGALTDLTFFAALRTGNETQSPPRQDRSPPG